jgi:hypothetical protein
LSPKHADGRAVLNAVVACARLACDHADGIDSALAAAERDPVLKPRIRLRD